MINVEIDSSYPRMEERSSRDRGKGVRATDRPLARTRTNQTSFLHPQKRLSITKIDCEVDHTRVWMMLSIHSLVGPSGQETGSFIFSPKNTNCE